jgi:hypothetical protein
MNDMEAASAIARAHYDAYEWSGCAGSSWYNLPSDVRKRLIHEADDWRASTESAGFDLVLRPLTP